MEDEKSIDFDTTNCTEIGDYVKNRIIKKNWEDVKRRFKSKIHTMEERMTVLHSVQKLTQTPVELTRHYIEANRNVVPVAALLHYVNSIGDDEKPDVEFIDELLQQGVDVNYLNENEENVLFKAIEIENVEMVKVLMSRGVDFRQISKHGCSVFHVAARTSSVAIVRLVADRFKKDELSQFIELKTNVEKQTALHYAAKEDSTQVADCFITEYKADKEAKDYRNRTPMFLAAEFNCKSMVKVLMSLKCSISFLDDSTRKETLNNNNGQTALYWIIMKMPEIAKEALDQLYEANSSVCKDKHYLGPLEPKVIENRTFIEKSSITAIIETGNLDLVVHPSVKCLVDIKWKKFGQRGAWIDLFLTIVNISVWVTFAVWIPYNARYNYDFSLNSDRFRLCLFILGIVFTVLFIVYEIREVYYEYHFQARAYMTRIAELNQYENEASVENQWIRQFLTEERRITRRKNLFKTFTSYVYDIWNLYDWISIILLCACIGTHIEDVRSHTEFKARLHIRIMSVTVIFISVRLFKSSRILNKRFGTLVMILYYSIYDMFIWFILYLVIWLSFSCSFWMIYGGTKFEESSNEDGVCKDVENLAFNTQNNCTTITIYEFEKFRRTAYYLYRLTFGYDLDETSMNSIDDQMTDAFIGTYIGLTALVFVNIFIALLSATFTRVYEKAEAYIVYQRAIEILHKEKTMSLEQRKAHIEFIRRNYNPYLDKKYNEIITSIDDRMKMLENELKEQRRFMHNMQNTVELSNLAIQNSLKQLHNEIKNLNSNLKRKNSNH